MIKQTTKNDCGPVAIINMVRWGGGNWNSKQIPMLREMMLTRKHGSELADILTVLEMIHPNRNVHFTRRSDLFFRALDNGRGLLLGYNVIEDQPHIVFAYKRDGKYLLTNMVLGEVETELTKQQIKNLLKRSYDVPAGVII